jgi:hypothetical protein
MGIEEHARDLGDGTWEYMHGEYLITYNGSQWVVQRLNRETNLYDIRVGDAYWTDWEAMWAAEDDASLLSSPDCINVFQVGWKFEDEVDPRSMQHFTIRDLALEMLDGIKNSIVTAMPVSAVHDSLSPRADMYDIVLNNGRVIQAWCIMAATHNYAQLIENDYAGFFPPKS